MLKFINLVTVCLIFVVFDIFNKFRNKMIGLVFIDLTESSLVGCSFLLAVNGSWLNLIV